MDPDGVDGLPPVTVECRMLELEPEPGSGRGGEGAVTVVRHDHEGRRRVSGHEPAGDLQVLINYPGANSTQLTRDTPNTSPKIALQK